MAKELHFQGPYTILTDKPKNLFKEEAAKGGGVYLWTFEGPDGYVIDYVGEATSITGRMIDHLKAQLSGMYNIYDPERLTKGERFNYWEGYHWKNNEQVRILDSIKRGEELVGYNYRMLDALRIYFASIDTTMRMRNRIESGILNEMMKMDFYNRSLQNPPQNRTFLKKEELPIQIEVSSDAEIVGLANSITI